MPKPEDFAYLAKNNISSLQYNAKKSTSCAAFTYLALLCFSLSSCFSGEKKNQNSLGATTTWPLDVQSRYHDERVTVEFKAGNIRRGRLQKSENPTMILLKQESQSTYYALKEILTIKLREDSTNYIYP